MEQLEIYIKGSGDCSCGVASYGIAMVWKGVCKTIYGGYKQSKTPRTEIIAMIKAFESLTRKGLNVVIYTRNMNLYRAIEGLSKKNLESRKNVDLWKELQFAARNYNISCKMLYEGQDKPKWDYYNMAVSAAKKGLKKENLSIDHVFEQETFGKVPKENKGILWSSPDNYYQEKRHLRSIGREIGFEMNQRKAQ